MVDCKMRTEIQYEGRYQEDAKQDLCTNFAN